MYRAKSIDRLGNLRTSRPSQPRAPQEQTLPSLAPTWSAFRGPQRHCHCELDLDTRTCTERAGELLNLLALRSACQLTILLTFGRAQLHLKPVPKHAERQMHSLATSAVAECRPAQVGTEIRIVDEGCLVAAAPIGRHDIVGDFVRRVTVQGVESASVA